MQYSIPCELSLFHNKASQTAKGGTALCVQGIMQEILSQKMTLGVRYGSLYGICSLANKLYHNMDIEKWRNSEHEEEKI